MHGRGVYSFASGDVYEGMFVAGEKSGQGKYTSSSGSVFIGQYVNDKRHGKGLFRYPGGATAFEGVWENDEVKGTPPVPPPNPSAGAKGRRLSLFR